MPIFKITNPLLLSRINEIDFALEKNLQTLIEKNIEAVFGLQLVISEFQLKDLRIDTLAFNLESNSFVIIEYKKDRNFSIIDQGFAYLSLLLNNKAEFTLLYNEKNNITKKISDIDWSQSKVLFVSPFFTSYQRKAIEFQDLPIELWEVKLYDNNTILFNQIQSVEKRESIKKLNQKSEIIKKVNQEIKVYNEDDSLIIFDQKIKTLYYKLRDELLNIGDNISIKPKKHYIAFKKNTNFVYINPTKSGLRMDIVTNNFRITDPNLVSKAKKYGAQVNLKNENDIPYVIYLVRQAYERN